MISCTWKSSSSSTTGRVTIYRHAIEVRRRVTCPSKTRAKNLVGSKRVETLKSHVLLRRLFRHVSMMI